MLESQNRVIMISGANRGIGFETAKLLQAKGYFLSLGALVQIFGISICKHVKQKRNKRM